jgi:hypothetical protein
MSDAPYTFGQAKQAAANASKLQKSASDFSREMGQNFARKEEAYRMALAEEIVRQHDAGVAWTVAQDMARGDKHVAKLRRERDIAEGMREAAMQDAWRRVADRKDTQAFIEWSKQRELAEGYGQVSEPDHQPIIGGVRHG